MNRIEINPGMHLQYGGGPVRGGWFTICCKVNVLRMGAARVQVKYLEGVKAGKIAWVTANCLTPLHEQGTGTI